MHQKYTAKSITAPNGGAPGMVLRTAGRAKRIVTAPVTILEVSTFNNKYRLEYRKACHKSFQALICTL